MCIGDWRLGRLIRTQLTAGSATQATAQAIAANKQRVGLTLALTSASIDNAQSALVTVDGVQFGISPSDSVLHLTLAWHGDLPTKAFTVKANSVLTLTFAIIEYTLPENYLACGLKEFQAEYSQWLNSR